MKAEVRKYREAFNGKANDVQALLEAAKSAYDWLHEAHHDTIQGEIASDLEEAIRQAEGK